MLNKCVFCGEQLIEGVCPNIQQHIKPMCINCNFCKEENENCFCLNEDNKLDAINKIKASFDGGYEIVGLDLNPLPLKEPTKRCKRYSLNKESIVKYLTEIL